MSMQPPKDPWMSAGGQGEYGHPKRNWGPREFDYDGAIERARRNLTTGSDTRLARLLTRLNQFMRW